MSPDWKWKSLLLLLVSALHLWLGWKLAHFRPERARATATHRQPQASSAELLMVLTFESRIDIRTNLLPRRTRSSRPHRAREYSGSQLSTAAASAPDGAAPESAAGTPLDLSLSSTPQPSFAPADVLRHASALEYRATRFDQAWISTGTLTDVIARKSQIAGALLGALGALRKTCTERQRSNYDSECVPDQYRHPEYGQ